MTKFEDELRSAIENGDSKHAFKAAALLLEILPELRGMVWQPIETAPKHQNVLVRYALENGNERMVKAAHFTSKTLEASGEFYDAEYDESQGNYFAPEGWYESLGEVSIMVDFSYYRMCYNPTHWMPIPTTTLTEKLKKAGVV